jgi:predicted TIM-barrel fold metal-dependent hydrolase
LLLRPLGLASHSAPCCGAVDVGVGTAEQMLDVAPVLPWYTDERARHGLDVVDVHTHVGQEDPDTMRCAPDELLAALVEADARAAVFPLQEPSGYRGPNAETIALAADSGGRLVAFARLDPGDEPVAEARRSLDAGARGLKLHPRGEGFALDHPALDDVWALADERRVPVIIHAGRGIPALGEHAVQVCERFPGARLILAHVGICDLAWIGPRAQELPNLMFDTSWWTPSDLLALFMTVPPGQILFASDAPYGRVTCGALQTSRAALQAGLTEPQLRLVMGGQSARLIAGEEPLDGGPSPGGTTVAIDVLLDRVATFLIAAFPLHVYGGPGAANELMALARLACAVPEDAPQAAHCRTILALLDAFEAERERGTEVPGILPAGMQLLVLALNVARTPDVPVPAELA